MKDVAGWMMTSEEDAAEETNNEEMGIPLANLDLLLMGTACELSPNS